MLTVRPVRRRDRQEYNRRMKETLKDPASLAQASSAFIPLEVYLRTFDYEPDAEYVDGVIEERPLPKYDHAAWQFAINLWFHNHRQEWNVRALPELRVLVAPTRVRIPDVTVLDRARPVEQIVTYPPIAIFEILSPGDSTSEFGFQQKLEDYQSMGIPQIWVIDPEDDSFFRYEYGQLTRREVFQEPAREISFNVQEIKAILNGC